MKNLFRPLVAGLLTSLAGAPTAAAQAPAVAGRLCYEATRRLDPGQVKITATRNGVPVTLSAAEMPELPTTSSFDFVLVIAGPYAKEERGQRQQASLAALAASSGATGAGSPPRVSYTRAAERTVYLDLAARTASTLLVPTERAPGAPSAYRADAPLPAPLPGWEYGPQTRKIAGYRCRKATVSYKKALYTLWVTTELPFTYAPVPELVPAQGVVLALSSDQEEYTATKFVPEAVAAADVRPPAGARAVSPAELNELEARAQADQRQRLLDQLSTGAPR